MNSIVIVFNVDGCLNIWGLYWGGITESPTSFLFGHEKRFDRGVAPSAHNYYIDVVYNYGMLSLLPIIALVLYTLIQVYKYKSNIFLSPQLLGLVVLVLFYIVLDNSVKVGFRQPYPGIVMFFLWGVLLTKLEQLRD